ncbi:hypothetical protein CQW23_23610 [Capsicum baccatum]|uniref:Uncharacterized protein n=1 Tax=Capsicum baccatum TaxID=33114 RepID=A0A2G2VSF6_CAPBA|nr:hypothetical protein CQW23_23610 [Capsicum baccatum]
MTMLKQLTINVPLVEALEQMPGYVKFMKDLLTKKREASYDLADNVHHCSAIATRSLVQKKADPRAFTIPCTIGSLDFAKALCDLGASINLIPLSIYKKLGLGDPTPTNIRLVMADRSVKRPVGILNDVLVKVSSFIFPADFVILDCKEDSEVPIILGRPFLATGSVLIDMKDNELLFRINDEVVRFDICKAMKHPSDMNELYVADVHHEDMKALSIEKQPTVEPLSAAPLKVEHKDNEDYKELMGALTEIESYTPKKPDCDLKNQPTEKTPINETPTLESQELPDYLRYAFLESRNILPESADDLSEQHVEALISALKRYKRDMGWTIDDIIGDSPEKRMSHLEEDCMPTGTMAPKARQGKEKATTSQKSKKKGRKEQEEPSSPQIPRLTLGIKWDTYEKLLRMTTLMMIPMQGIERYHSINLIPLSVYRKLGLGDPTPTNMQLMMADWSVKQPVGVLNDVLVKVSTFIFPADFVILDCEVDVEVPMKKLRDMDVFSIADVHYEDKKALFVEKRLTVKPLSSALLNVEHEYDEDYEEIMCALTIIGFYSHTPKQSDLDLKNQLSPTVKTSIEEPPVLESKEIPSYLRYAFLGSGNTLSVSAAADVGEQHVEALISALKRYKRAISWSIDDIIGILPRICMRKGHLEEDCIPTSINDEDFSILWTVERQRKLHVRRRAAFWSLWTESDARKTYPRQKQHFQRLGDQQ